MLATQLKLIIVLLVGLLVVGCIQRLKQSVNQRPSLVHIHVQVHGGSAPLRNVQVELYREQFEPIPGELVGVAVTNEQGFANLQVEPGTYGFWVRALDMSAQWRYEGPTRFTFTRDQEIQVYMLPAY